MICVYAYDKKCQLKDFKPVIYIFFSSGIYKKLDPTGKKKRGAN